MPGSSSSVRIYVASVPALALVLGLGGCVGAIDDSPGAGTAGGAPTGPGAASPGTSSPGPLSGGSASGAPPANPIPTPSGPAAACAPGAAGALAPLRRLTREEYENTIRDLFGDAVTIAQDFLGDERGAGVFRSNNLAPAGELLLEKYAEAAESIAAAASRRPAGLLTCDPARDEQACARTFISDFGRRVFRRPLESAEVTDHLTLFTEARQGGTFGEGIRLVLTAMLQSPHFLYRPEIGAGTAGAPTTDGLMPLSAYEIASRLSYFLWASPPDAALLAAAQTGTLATAEGVAREARRMLATPTFGRAIASFHRQWLGLDELATLEKDAKLHPEFTPELRRALLGETLRFADHVVREGDGRLETLLTSSFTFLTGPLPVFYGNGERPSDATGPDGYRRTPLDTRQRLGLLTHGSVMAAHAHKNQTSPVLRGQFVRESLLCETLPEPPADADVTPPNPAPGSTTRQRFDVHRKDPACAGCHALMDPIGFGFESYDAAGRFRTTEAGVAIDTTGAIRGGTTDIEGPFTGSIELVRKLAGSKTVARCMTTQWYRFALGRSETPSEACVVDRLFATFGSAGLDIRELLVAIVASDAFRFRRAP